MSCTDLRVQFDPDSYTVVEGNHAQFRVTLNGEADRPVSVTFNTVAGTATGESIRTETQFRNFQVLFDENSENLAYFISNWSKGKFDTLYNIWHIQVNIMLFSLAPDDYTSVTSRTVTFPAVSTQQTVAVQTSTDSMVDNSETFTATLSDPTNGLQLGSAVTGTATILDRKKLYHTSYQQPHISYVYIVYINQFITYRTHSLYIFQYA